MGRKRARNGLVTLSPRWCDNCGQRLWISKRFCWFCKWLRMVGDDGW